MDSNVFCVLCGASFDIENHVYNIDPETKTYQWVYNVRLLSDVSALCNLRRTSGQESGPNTSGSDDVFLSESIQWASTDSDLFRLDHEYHQVFDEDEEGQVIFPLHDACIQIGCRVLEQHPAETMEMNKHSTLFRLYTLLRTHFHYKMRFEGILGNDMLDLNTESLAYGPRSVLALDELGWWGEAHEKFLTDPIDVPGLSPFVKEVLSLTLPKLKDISRITTRNRECATLESLPNELLDQILAYLPPQCVINLHRTSRLLAFKVPLDDRFWRTHLLDGTLVPHIWDLEYEYFEEVQHAFPNNTNDDQISDWCSLVELLQRKDFPICGRDHRLDNLPPGYWNRCRIWTIIEELCTSDYKHHIQWIT